jgi:hypothetical protein
VSKREEMCSYFAGFLLSLLFGPEDRGSTFIQNISKLQPDYTVSHPKKKKKKNPFCSRQQASNKQKISAS